MYCWSSWITRDIGLFQFRVSVRHVYKLNDFSNLWISAYWRGEPFQTIQFNLVNSFDRNKSCTKDLIKYLQKSEGCTYIYIYIYIYISAVKVNALMQIPYNATNFINVRLTHRLFSVWPVAQPVVD